MSDELDLVQRLQNACNDYEADLLENAFVTIIEARFLEAAEEITRLRASIALKDKALRKVEWSGSPGFEECSWCGEYKHDGHAPTCPIAEALKE